MAEPRLAKRFAIVVGGIEFLFGFVFSIFLFFGAMLPSAYPQGDSPLKWPVVLLTVVLVTCFPVAVAYKAESAAEPLTVYVCLGLLLTYPLLLYGGMKLYAA